MGNRDMSAANAARSRAAEEKLAAKLIERGWKVLPPPEYTDEIEARAERLRAAALAYLADDEDCE